MKKSITLALVLLTLSIMIAGCGQELVIESENFSKDKVDYDKLIKAQSIEDYSALDYLDNPYGIFALSVKSKVKDDFSGKLELEDYVLTENEIESVREDERLKFDIRQYKAEIHTSDWIFNKVIGLYCNMTLNDPTTCFTGSIPYYAERQDFLDINVIYESNLIEHGEFAYRYAIFDSLLYGKIIYYFIYEKIDFEWKYSFEWACSEFKRNMEVEELEKQQLLYCSPNKFMEDDYFCITYDAYDTEPQFFYVYLNNGCLARFVFNRDATSGNLYCRQINIVNLSVFDIVKEEHLPTMLINQYINVNEYIGEGEK